MATQDVLTTAITSLMELANPSANAAQIEALQTQIASLQQQLAQAQAQLQALQGNDGQTAQQVLQMLRRMSNGVVGGGPAVATAVKGAFTAATPVANAALTTAAAAQTASVSVTPSASS